MFRLIALLWEASMAWLIRPRILIAIIASIIIGGGIYYFVDIPAIVLSIKAFVKKTLPKWGSALLAKTTPLLAKAFAKTTIKNASLLFFGWMMTKKFKESLDQNIESVLVILKRRLFYQPKEWWTARNLIQKVLVVGALIFTLSLFIGALAFNALFFIPLTYLKTAILFVLGWVWKIVKIFLPKIGAGKVVVLLQEKLAPFLWSLVPKRIKDSPVLRKTRVRMVKAKWKQLRKLVGVRHNIRVHATELNRKHKISLVERRRRIRARREQRAKRRRLRQKKRAERNVLIMYMRYAMTTLIFVSLSVYPSVIG